MFENNITRPDKVMYNLERKCKNCGNIDIIQLTKFESAFNLYDSKKIWTQECSKCESKSCQSIAHQNPKIDKELLDTWGNNPELFFMEQDQELLLAEYDYLPLLLDAIDNSKYLDFKIDVLIESVCIILYDNIISPEEFTKEENENRSKISLEVREELIKRKDRVLEAGDTIMDYVKEVVYPYIGMSLS